MVKLLLYFFISVTTSTSSSPVTHTAAYPKPTTTTGKTVMTEKVKSFTQIPTIGEVVITGKRSVPAVRILIPRKSIEENGVESSDKITKITPVLNVEDTSRGDRYLYLAGFNYRQIQMYLDGVPVYIPYSGDIGADLLKLVNIKEIVVEPVLPSLFYGPNAMGGAINILSTTPTGGIHGKFSAEINQVSNKNGRFNISAGENNYYAGASGMIWNSPGFPLSKKFTSSLNENGEVRENSYTKGYTFFGYTGYNRNQLNFFTLRYYKTSMEKGVPPEVGSTKPRYWRFTDWEKEFLNFVGRKSLGENSYIKLNSAYTGYYNVLDSYDDSTYSTQTKRYAFHSTYDDYSLLSSLTGGITKGIISTDLLFTYRKDIHREQPDYNEEWSGYGQEIYSAGLRSTASAKKIIFSAEGRYDKLAAFKYPNSDALNYRASLRYNFKNGNAGIAIGSTTRFPTMKEKYSYHLGRSIPNPNLKPESQDAIILNFSTPLFYGIKINGFGYYSKLKNLIESVKINSSTDQNQNISRAFLTGFYLEGLYQKSGILLKAALQGTWTKDLEHDTTLPYRPRWRSILSAGYSGKKFSLLISLNGQYITFYEGKDVTDLHKLGSWTTIGLHGDFHIDRNIKIYTTVENLFDKNYETDHGFPAAGREIFAGIVSSF